MRPSDQNRALVLNANRLGDIINLLADDSILAFVIPVLYNILVDYGKIIFPEKIQIL